MSKFFMMVGLPASGKSTEAKKLQHIYNADIVSTDVLRAELLGDTNSQVNNSYIFDVAHSLIISSLHKGGSVIFDATNLQKVRRVALLERLKNIADVDKVAVVLDPPLSLCKKRNEARERVVPEEVMDRMNSQFTRYQIPTCEEGFDTVVYIQKVEDKDNGGD